MNYIANKKILHSAIIIILVVFTMRLVSVINIKSATFDENLCVQTGVYLANHTVWDSQNVIFHPPLSYLWHGLILKNIKFHDDNDRLHWARISMLLFPILLGFYIFKYGNYLFGPQAGLIALVLYTFSPDILAQAGLVTQDVLVATFVLISLYYYEKCLGKSDFKSITITGICVGLSLLSKYTSIILLPILLFRMIVYALQNRRNIFKEAYTLFYVLLAALIILNCSYLFSGTFSSLNSYIFKNHLFENLSTIPIISQIPLPFPAPYLYGIDLQNYIAELKQPSYLMGAVSYSGWWYYLPISILIKTQIPLLILAIISIFRLRINTNSKISILIPVTIFLISFAPYLDNSPKLRYILPVYPFMFLLISELSNAKSRIITSAFYGLLFLLVIESISIHPNYIAYFNQLIGGSQNGYKYLVDSNLDWGQDNNQVQSYVEKYKRNNDKVVLKPLYPSEGIILVDANNLVDCFRARERYAWLREFIPINNINYSWQIYDIDYKKLVSEEQNGIINKPIMYYTLGWLSRNNKNYIYAKKYIDVAIQKLLDVRQHTESNKILLGRCYLLLGLIAIDEGNLSKAEQYLHESLTSYPYLHESYSVLTWIADFEKDKTRAELFKREEKIFRILEWYIPKVSTDTDKYLKIIEANQNDFKAHNNLGFVYWMKGDINSAIREFETARSINPYYIVIYTNLACSYFENKQMGKYEEALKEYYLKTHDIKSIFSRGIDYGQGKILFDEILAIPLEEIVPLNEIDKVREIVFN